MANNSFIQIKRSNTTNSPTSLYQGEMAWSNSSQLLYIGNPDGSNTVTPIGSKLNWGVLTANAVMVTNSTSGIDKINVGNAVLSYVYAGGFGTSGQYLTSNSTGGVSWTTPASGVAGLTTQIQYNNGGTLAGSAGFTFNNTTNNVTVANTLVAANINIGSIGAASNGVVATANVIQIGNTSVYTNVTPGSVTVVGGTFTGNGINITSVNATNITTGTLPWAQAPTGTANLTGNQTFSGNDIFSANLTVTGAQFLVGAAANAVTVTPTTINVGNSTVNATINSTAFTGTSLTANNSTYLNGQLASYYTNASNITTGTLPWSQAPTNTVNTTASSTFTGNNTFQGTNTIFQSNASFTANVYVTGTEILVGSTANAVTVTATTINVGNSTVNATINSTSFTGTALTANNSTYLNGQLASYYTNASNITTGTLPWAQAPTGTANLSAVQTFAGNTTFSANLSVTGSQFYVGTSANAVTVTPTTINVGNSTVNATINSTSFSGTSLTANNATYLNGQLASYYTNASNITTGTLPWSQAPTNAVNTTASSTFTGNNIFQGTNTVFQSNVLFSGVNNTINGTTLTVGANTTFSGANTNIGGTNTNITSNVSISGSSLTLTGTSITGTTSDVSFRNGTFSGNLTVSGTVTSINTAQLTVNDNIVELGYNNLTTDAVDTGWFSPAGNTTTIWYSGLARIATKSANNNAYFYLFSSNTNPNTNPTIDLSSNTGTSTLQAYLLPYGVGGAFVANSTVVNITANSTVSSTLTVNSITLSTALAATSGGTGVNTYAAGDLLYAGSANPASLSKLSVPGTAANGQVLQITNNLPAYGALDGGTF